MKVALVRPSNRRSPERLTTVYRHWLLSVSIDHLDKADVPLIPEASLACNAFALLATLSDPIFSDVLGALQTLAGVAGCLALAIRVTCSLLPSRKLRPHWYHTSALGSMDRMSMLRSSHITSSPL
jgi:hypothetical protein